MITKEQKKLALDRIEKDIKLRCEQLLQIATESHTAVSTKSIEINPMEQIVRLSGGHLYKQGNMRYSYVSPCEIQDCLKFALKSLIKKEKQQKRLRRRREEREQQNISKALKNCLPDPMSEFLIPKKQWRLKSVALAFLAIALLSLSSIVCNLLKSIFAGN